MNSKSDPTSIMMLGAMLHWLKYLKPECGNEPLHENCDLCYDLSNAEDFYRRMRHDNKKD